MCESAKDLATYLKAALPKLEEILRNAITAKEKSDLAAKFDAALKAKNWDDVYVSGKDDP